MEEESIYSRPLEFSFSFFLSLSFWFSTLSSAMDFRETGNCSRSKVPWEDNPDRGEREGEREKERERERKVASLAEILGSRISSLAREGCSCEEV